ncbi:MAG: flagellar biosynthetic protein FliR [Nevskiaceae bacterium]|nr:MAG: flagellar biosynthetic protein FliR [Nevskiaceae bacterium]
MHLTDVELLGWLQRYFWTFTRISGVLMTAPVIGARMAPARVRLMLALTLTLMLAPLLPAAPVLELFGAAWWLVTAQQLLIGVAIGFVLQLVFEAVTLGGELMSASMGLSFAQMVDPVRGNSSTVIGQILTLLVSLLFLALQGHLALIQTLADSFHTLPVGESLATARIGDLVRWSAMMFSGGLRIALPVMIALLLVNMAYGVMSRATPSLNMQSVGFPISLVAGLLLLQYSLPGLQAVFTDLFNDAWPLIASLLRTG